MIATIKAEWRKNRFRPAFLVSSGVIAAITVMAYGISWYQALHPAASDRGRRRRMRNFLRKADKTLEPPKGYRKSCPYFGLIQSGQNPAIRRSRIRRFGARRRERLTINN